MAMDNLDFEKQKLLEAYRVSINANSTNHQRSAAFSLFEGYKDNPDKCLTLGSLLIVSNEMNEKLLGFELLQNFIRRGWVLTDWNIDMLKAKFKCEIIIHLKNDLAVSSLEQLQILKNSISKLLVSLIIQEFPQKWPELLAELYQISDISIFHNIIVLSIFQRVAEEIINHPNSSLPTHRTKDVRQFLIRDSNLEPLVSLICRNVLIVQRDEVTEVSSRLAISSLYCLNQYIEWMPFVILERSNIREYLVLFLDHEIFLVAAVDCLIGMLKRRNGSVKERAFLLSFFKMPVLQKLGGVVHGKTIAEIDERRYLILKKLLELITEMNNFYLSILSKFANELRSISTDEYRLFLECLFAFRSVQSHVLTSSVLTNVLSNLKHISCKHNSEAWKRLMPVLYECSLFILTKNGFPSMIDHPSSKFAQIDFGDDLECGSFIAQGRSLGCDIIKTLVDLDLKLVSQIVLQDASVSLQDWCNISMSNGDTRGKDATLEAKMLAFTTFVSKLDLAQTSGSTNAEIAELYPKIRKIFLFSLEMCENERNVNVMNALLTVLSSLFVFWFETQENFVRVIKLIFKCFYFESTQANKKSHLIHRHASSLLLGKAVDNLALFLPFYDDFFPILSECFLDKNVDRSCRTAVLECLVALTASVKDPVREDNLRNLIRTPVSIFESLAFNLSDVGTFVPFMGLTTNCDFLPHWDEMQDIRFSITAINGFLRRFVNAAQKQVSMNPTNGNSAVMESLGIEIAETCSKPIATVLQRFHELHDTSVKAHFSSQFTEALEVSEIDRRNLLGIQLALAEVNESIEKTPVYRVQGYVKEIHTNAIQALCSCVLLSCSRLENDSNLCHIFLNTVFHNFANLSNYFIGNVISFYLIPLKDKCPERYHKSVLLPFLKQSLAIIFPRLCQDWEKFCRVTVEENSEDAMKKLKGESDDMSEEVLEDLFLRRNTRSVISVITTLMLANPSSADGSLGGAATDANASNDVTDKMIPSSSVPSALKPRNELKKFAMLVFQDDALYENLILILINAFVWPDTPASTKSAMIFWPLFQPIIERGPSNEVVSLVLTQLLKGYQVNEYCTGTSPLLLSLVFKFYLSLRPRYPIIKDIFYQIPEIVPANFEKFEKEVFVNYVEGHDFPAEKKWKDALRNILKGVVGRPISSMYRDNIIVSKLPEVPPKMKMEYDERTLLDCANVDNGVDDQLLLLFSWLLMYVFRIIKYYNVLNIIFINQFDHINCCLFRKHSCWLICLWVRFCSGIIALYRFLSLPVFVDQIWSQYNFVLRRVIKP